VRRRFTAEEAKSSLKQRFLQRIDVTRGCWVWTGSTVATNPRHPRYRYGTIRAAHQASWTYAHRAAYEMFIGPIPDGMTVDHICFNPLCVNPAHLQLLTRSENSARKGFLNGHGTFALACETRDTCKHGHPWPAKFRRTPKGVPYCLECVRLQQRARAQRLKEASK
jgi:hypothetical protein